MIRQCMTCQTVLPERARSPYCLPHYLEHQKERNRAKSRRHRERESIYHPEPDAPPPGRLPNEEELEWLAWLDLGLAEPIQRIVELRAAGRTIADPEVQGLARAALERYDCLRADFDERATLRPDPQGHAAKWRGFFESIRGAYP